MLQTARQTFLRCEAVKMRHFWTTGTKRTNTSDNRKTVDQSKVNIFANIAKDASWWDKNSELISLYKYHEASLPSLIKSIAEHYNRKDDTGTKLFQGLNVLDIGCGVGFISERLAKHGAKVTGIDVCDNAIDRAIEHSKLDSDLAGKLHYQVSSIENFYISNKDLYDVVILAHVMDYVNEPDLFLKLCCLKTKPGGLFIVEAKNRTITSYITLLLWGTISRQVPKGLFTWSKFNKPNEITKVLEENGFQNLKIVGHGMPLLYNMDKLKLSDNVNTFYMVTAARKK